MTQETTLIVETEVPIMMECADGTGIEKGAILKLSDPLTAAKADGDGDIIAGIAAEEKIASDGKTKIAVYRGGIFKGTSNGGSSVGDVLMTYASTGDENDIKTATGGTAAGAGLGIALETASNDETFLFELRPGVSEET
jgi:hypothetical protein